MEDTDSCAYISSKRKRMIIYISIPIILLILLLMIKPNVVMSKNAANPSCIDVVRFLTTLVVLTVACYIIIYAISSYYFNYNIFS